MSDIFNDIADDMRRERVGQLWRRYGPYLVGLAVLIVLATAGWRLWEYWLDRKSEAAATGYIAAAQVAQGTDHAAAAKSLADFAAGAPEGYATLARFRASAAQLAAGDSKGALATLDQIAGDKSVSRTLRDFADLRAAMILVDTADYDTVARRLGNLMDEDNPWRRAAHETLAIAAIKAERWDMARQQLERLVGDSETPSDQRARAEILMNVVVGAAGRTPAAAAVKGAGS